MVYNLSGFPCSDELYHYGILGQKWGVRRYQNSDGTLTTLGKIHYGASKVGETIGNAAKTTGKAVSTASKKVAKYEIEKFKRNHPWMMSDAELNYQIEKAKKIETLSNTRANIRGKTFIGKMSNTFWKSVGVGTDKLAENFSTQIGKEVANRLMESNAKREARQLQEQIDLTKARKNYRENQLQEAKNYDDYTYRKNLYENSKRLEREANSQKKEKNNKSNEPAIGSKKAVDAYVKAIEDEEEKKRRKALYGPGGTAYR